MSDHPTIRRAVELIAEADGHPQRAEVMFACACAPLRAAALDAIEADLARLTPAELRTLAIGPAAERRAVRVHPLARELLTVAFRAGYRQDTP